MDITTSDKLAKIREENDKFRTTFRGGTILLTQGVTDLPSMVAAAALQKVAEFKDWTPDIDPHGEHDYLSFDLCNREFVFIIQYWNLEIDGPSIDPADPGVTTRIATLMLVHEW
jgi:Protein of unknown function (DUF3768)